jgi:hypothetical protein
MEVQNIIIFVLIGAVCMFIITGGAISMTSDVEPSQTHLASGAAIGGILGAAAGVLSSSTSDLSDMFDGLSTSAPDMKVGLPSF